MIDDSFGTPGHLVHVNSLVGARDDAHHGAYSVSKAATLRLGGVLGSSLAGTGVACSMSALRWSARR